MSARGFTHPLNALAGIMLGLAACLPAHADTAFALGADAGAMQPLTGVNVGPVAAGDGGNPAVGPAYRARGVRLVRTHDFYGPLDMATMYPDRTKSPTDASSFRFTTPVGSQGQTSDGVFAAIVDGGFEPYFRLGDSYNNVAVPTTGEQANWVTAAVNVLRHYREGQWNGFRSDFRHVEIWNEPDNLQFWPRPNTRTQFFELYIATAKAVRAAFPSLKIGGPGLTPGGCKTESGQQWTTAFLDAVKTAGAPLDFFSWHIYSNAPADYTTCMRFYRQALDTRGFTATELHLTEWNTDAESAAASDKGPLRTGARGAAILSAGWIALQQEGLAQSLFYRGTDPSMNLPTFYGMFYADGQPKKVADAAILWNTMRQYPRRQALTGGSSTLSALGGGTESGARAILLANTGTTPEAWTATLGGASLADYRVALLTVSDAAAGVVAGSTQTVPGESVQLALFTPRTQRFSATASVSGSAEAMTLSALLNPEAADVGATRSIFVAALAGGRFYCLNDLSWGSCGSATAAWSGPLPARLELPLLQGFDTRSLSGVELYLGYGSSLDEVVSRQRYTRIHRF